MFAFLKKPPVEPRASQHTPELVARFLDEVACLHGDFEQVVLKTTHQRPWLIESMTVSLASALPVVPDDRGLRTALASKALADLLRSVSVTPDAMAALEVTATPAEVQVLGKRFARGRQLLFGRAFIEACAALPRSAEQAAWQGKAWDRRAGALHVVDASGGARSVEAQLLGSFSPTESTWCWAWANGSLRDATQTGIVALRQRAPLPLFAAPGFPCTEPFSFVVAALAAHALDPRLIVWRWPKSPHLFFGLAPDLMA